MRRLGRARVVPAILLAVVLAVYGLSVVPSPTNAHADAPVLFSDGFESGTLSAWTAGSGLVVQQSLVADGAWAARATMTGAAASAYRSLTTPTSELTARLKVQVVSIAGSAAVNFLKLRTSTGGAITELFVTPSRNLGLRNDVT